MMLLLALTPGASVTQASPLGRSDLAPLAASVPGEPLTLNAQQSQEIAVLVTFIRAYNAGHVRTALSLFIPYPGWSDCDYRRGVVVVGDTKASLRRWLQQRAADHDRLDLGNVVVGAPGTHVLGVTFKRRTSDTLRSLGRLRGITPTLGAKVIFDGRTGATIRPAIDRFANGPFGGDSSTLATCRIQRPVAR
jgi:hypothetical protein